MNRDDEKREGSDDENQEGSDILDNMSDIMSEISESKSEPSSPRESSPLPQPQPQPQMGIMESLRTFRNPENVLFRTAPVQKYSLDLYKRGSPIDVDQVVQSISAYGAYDSDIHTVEEMIRQGNLEGLKYLADIGEDVHYAVETPLVLAAFYGNLDIFRYLVEEQKANLNTDDWEDGNVFLNQASQKGHLNIIQYILTDATVNNLDNLNAALRQASEYDKFNVVEYLTEYIWSRHGNQIDINGAIVAAAKSHSIEILRYLQAFANRNNLAFDINAALSSIAYDEHVHKSWIDAIKYLVNQGAIPERRHLEGVIREMIKIDNDDIIDIVEFLLKRGVSADGEIRVFQHEDSSLYELLIKSGRTGQNDVSDVFYIDCTLLEVAVGYGRKDLVRLLLEHKANVHANDDCAFIMAVAKLIIDYNNPDVSDDRLTIVRLLLRYGAKVDIYDGWALFQAVEHQRLELIKLLLHYGANPDIDRLKILKKAKEKRNTEILTLLLEYSEIHPNAKRAILS
ncbi:MAG: ankyrin repeat domain-containing protein [bacterium]